ncbi:MAG: bacterial Ig-like domain-containing protein [Candidatus Margulisbacteria bacterium]|nr:bacterial Ig-like domain-containing protein [Candidatus Margulisiibacteriota bacterium]
MAGCGVTKQSSDDGSGGSGGRKNPPPVVTPPPPGWDDGLTGIEVTTNKTEYFVGEQIIVSVNGIYHGVTENPENITNYAEISGADSGAAGVKTITALAGGFEDNVDVLVKEAKVVSIVITQAPDKTTYLAGIDTQIDLTGIKVTGTLRGGQQIELATNALQVVGGYDLSAGGAQTITVKYVNTDSSEVTAGFQITGLTLTELIISPGRTKYIVGEEFDQTAMTVTADYSGTYRAVSLTEVVVDASNYNKNVLGTHTIRVTYRGIYSEFTVTVVPPVLELTINSGANRQFILPIHNNTVNDLYIDWGDGIVQHYTNSPSNYAGVPHTYLVTNTNYTIKISGSTYFTGANSQYNGALGFGFAYGDDIGGYNNSKNKNSLLAVSGNLVALLGNYTPASNDYMFSGTFSDCKGLTGSIPADLFSGISGAPAQDMFYLTFFGCRGLTGSIPADLFSGISGVPASGMFENTFYCCDGLTGSIPADLFSGISGAPTSNMFSGTFSDCKGLTGSIPADLFSGISGVPAQDMFYLTFSGCSGLIGIDDPFIGTLTETYNFAGTFPSSLKGKQVKDTAGTVIYSIE